MSEVDDPGVSSHNRADSTISMSSLGSLENETFENNSNNGVKVYCRFRPFIKFELTNDADRKAQCSVAFHKLGKNALLKHGVAKPIKFDFDRVFQPSSTQENVYEVAGASIIEDTINGCNCIVISCGGSLSGKTYVLLGANTNWGEVEAVNPSDGLLIRCCRAIYDYINEASEKEEFTLRFAVNKIKNDKVIGVLNGDNHYVSSVRDIGALLEQAQSALDPKESATICYMLKLSQTNSSSKVASTLCFVDLDLTGIESLESILDSRVGGRIQEAIGIQSVLRDTMLGNYKVHLIGNCSPHISAVAQTQKTMEMVTSVPSSVNWQPITNRIPNSEVKLISPITVPKINSFEDIPEEQIRSLTVQREMLHANFQIVSEVIRNLKHEQSQMKSYWRDTVLQTQDKIIDDFSSVFVDRERQFLDGVSSLNAKHAELLARYDSLLIEKEELDAQLTTVTAQVVTVNEKLREKSRDLDSLQERCWAAEAEAHRVLEEKTDLEIILKMKNEELETSAKQVKETEELIQILNTEISSLKADCKDLEAAREVLGVQEEAQRKLQIEPDETNEELEEKHSKVSSLEAQSIVEESTSELLKIKEENAELELQISQLRTQLIEKEAVQQELHSLKTLCETYGEECNQLNRELLILSEKEKEHSKIIEDLVAQLRDKESIVSTINGRCKDLETEVSNEKHENEMLQNQLSEISRERDSMLSTLESVQKEYLQYRDTSEIQKREQELTEQLKTLDHSDKLKDLEFSKTTMEQQIQAYRDTIELQKQDIAKHREENNVLIVEHKTLIDKLQDTVSALESENIDLKTKMEEQQVKLTQSALKIAQDASTIMEQFDRIVKLEEQVIEESPLEKELSDKLERLHIAFEDSQKQLETKKEEISLLIDKLKVIEEEREEYSTNISNLHSQVKDLAGVAQLKEEIINDQNSEVLKLQQELAALEQEKKEMILINEELSAKNKELEQKVVGQHEQKEDKEDRVNFLSEQIERLLATNNEIQLQLNMAEVENENLKREVEVISQQKSEEKMINEKHQARITVVERSNNELDSNLKDIQALLSSVQIERDDAIRKMDEIMIENKNLKTQFEQETNESHILQHKLEDSHSSELIDIHWKFEDSIQQRTREEQSINSLVSHNQIYEKEITSLRETIDKNNSQQTIDSNKGEEEGTNFKDLNTVSEEISGALSHNQKLDELHAPKESLEIELSNLQNMIHTKDELIEELRGAINSIRTETSHRDNIYKQLQDYEHSAKAEISNLKLEVESYQDEEQKMRISLTNLEEERLNLQQKLEQAMLLLQDTNETDNYLKEIELLRNDKDNLYEQNAELLEKISAVNLEVDRWANKCKLKEVMVEEAEKRNEKLSKEISLLEERFENIQEELIDVQRELRLKSDLLLAFEQDSLTPDARELQTLPGQAGENTDAIVCQNTTITITTEDDDDNKGEERFSMLETSQNDSTIVEDLQSAIADMKKENESLREEVTLLRSQSESSEVVHRELESLRISYNELKEKYEVAIQGSSTHHSQDSHQQQLLGYIQSLVRHIEKMKQEILYYQNSLVVKEHESRSLKSKNDQKDTLISFLYNQISTTTSAKSNQADKMKVEIDQLMDIINRSKRNLTQPRSTKQRLRSSSRETSTQE